MSGMLVAQQAVRQLERRSNTMKLRLNYLTLAAVLGLVACDKPDPAPTSVAPPEAERPTAETTPEDRGRTKAEMTHETPKAEAVGDREADAKFESAPNMKVAGNAELEETDTGGVEIEVEISGAPVGKQGLQIVHAANCSDVTKGAPPGTTTPLGDDRLGDLGNITIEDDGEGELKITIPNANLDPGDAKSFIGKSIVLYEAEAKGTGASAEAGKPIACAPIKAS